MRLQAIRRAAVLVAILGGASPVALAQGSANLKMGNPSQAQTDQNEKNNYLLDREYFATSYNNAKGTPNWVSWRLSVEDLGRAPRVPFYADPDLPEGFLRVTPADYTNSGFDRGHMCPHGDRTRTVASSTATFTMTNMIPQSHDLNTKAWDSLEGYIRDLAANQGKICYIIDGPSGQGGTGKKGLMNTTPDGKVVVPSTCWKVAMILDQDVASAKNLTADSTIRLIAAVMPNADGAVGEDWTPFRTTVKEVEALTGYTFFNEVDPAIINPLKERSENLPLAPAALLVLGRPDRGAPVPGPQNPALIANREAVMSNSAMMSDLKKAIQGLSYPSESDEPFQAIDLGRIDGPLTDEKLLTLAGQDLRARVDRVDAARFFAPLTTPQPTQGQINAATAQRFSALQGTLNTHLSDIRVIKFGQAEVVIYIIGRTKEGTYAGVKTAATET